MNMQMFIRGWLVFEITGSYEKLGWMTAAGGVVGLFAGRVGGDGGAVVCMAAFLAALARATAAAVFAAFLRALASRCSLV